MKRLIPFFFGAALCIPMSSSAATFDDVCAPETEHTPATIAPNLAFMLDQSGSMANPSSESGKSRWKAAKEAINETVQAFTDPDDCDTPTDPGCDKVHFGLALFNSNTSFPVKVGENTASDIADELSDASPENRTAMGVAAKLLKNESTLNDASRSNNAVFITDGYPYVSCPYAGNRDTLVDAVIALCTASNRENPLTTSVIGFGGDTNKDVISLLAAAGGTGSCCDTAACSTTPIDVCEMTASELNALIMDVPYVDNNGDTCHNAFPDPSIVTCSGGIDIVTNTDLKDEITKIVKDVSCTFPLDIPTGYPDDAAQADPDYTRVELIHGVHGNVVLDYIGDCDAPTANTSSFDSPAYDDEGWCFVNNRRSIRVTSKLCADIGANDVEKVITQVACVCKFTGDECDFMNILCDGQPCSIPQLNNMPCSDGVYICDEGIDVCTGSGASALPEICNGVDDNCDGHVDNLGEAEPDWDAYPTQKAATGLHCEFENVCECVGGASAPVTVSGGVDQLLLDSILACSCQSALEFEESSIQQEESDNSQDKAASCSALSKDPTGLLYLLLPIGLIGVISRRRKS